jgi:hypothetical protein
LGHLPGDTRGRHGRANGPFGLSQFRSDRRPKRPFAQILEAGLNEREKQAIELIGR